MKKILNNMFLAVVGAFLVLALAITLGKATFAQTVDGTALETQIGNLVSTLEKVFLEEKDSGGSAIMTFSVGSGVPNPTCLDNYTTWSHSTTYLPDAPWNLDFIPRENTGASSTDSYINEQFVDLNGDGLADYIYKYAAYTGSSSHFGDDQTCVYLNNGAGYDLAYRCVSSVVYNANGTIASQNYYGDCADM